MCYYLMFFSSRVDLVPSNAEMLILQDFRVCFSFNPNKREREEHEEWFGLGT